MLPNLPFKDKFTSSRQLIPGSRINGLSDLLTSVKTGLTATPGGNNTNSVQLKDAFNEVSAVATANDSVLLPVAKAGLSVGIFNADAADSLRIFGSGTDTIKAGAGAATASSDLAAVTAALFICFKDGLWIRFTSA